MLFSHLSTSPLLLYGFGVEGKASLKFLNSHFPEKQIDIYDQNIKEYSEQKDLSAYDVIIVSPGISRTQLTGVDPQKLTSGSEIFFANISEECRQKTIGITGSKGKSTTTKLCKELLEQAGYKVAIGGNFGVPLLDLYDDFVTHKLDYLVIEFSSYQLENLKISPHYSLFLNFFPDHIDRHGSLENYFSAKKNLWWHQQNGDICFVAKQYQELLEKNQGEARACAPLPADFFPPDSVLRAPHWLQNFGTVYALARELSISDETIKECCQNFQGLEHRLEQFITKNGITFVNDANATTPEAAVAAAHFLGSKIGTMIVGGQNRSYDFNQLVSTMMNLNIHIIILKSESGQIIRELLDQNGYSQYSLAKDMPEIIAQSFQHTPSGKICLLSMGSPSYGHFSGFEEKGRLFKGGVREYE